MLTAPSEWSNCDGDSLIDLSSMGVFGCENDFHGALPQPAADVLYRGRAQPEVLLLPDTSQGFPCGSAGPTAAVLPWLSLGDQEIIPSMALSRTHFSCANLVF